MAENVQAALLAQHGMNMMDANAAAAAQAAAQAQANHEMHVAASQGAVAEMLAAAQQEAMHVHALHAGAEGFYTHGKQLQVGMVLWVLLLTCLNMM
jgi:hypothetical protein